MSYRFDNKKVALEAT